MKRGEKNSSIVRKKGKLIPVLLIVTAAVALLSVIVVFISMWIKRNSGNSYKELWTARNYPAVYEKSTNDIEKNPLDNSVLIYRGYAAFYIAVSENNPELALSYIDESIRCLRVALFEAKEKTVPQIKYMLGKAYFHKNIICSYHFYADLVVKYLQEALDAGYQADDIPELLGLSYGQLGMPYESIKSFSDALLVHESPFLLFNIAKEYYAQGQISAAKQYLFQVTSNAGDDILLIKSQNLLAKIYIDEEKYEDAKALYEQVLEKDDNCAETHYGLGVIYEKNGDLIKARSEWRKSLNIDSTYEDALKKVYR